MPPLKAEKYVHTPFTEEEKALRNEVENLKADLWERADSVLPHKKEKLMGANKEVHTPKAFYQVDGQPDGERTRAWLSRHPGSNEISIWTDRVTIDAGTIPAIQIMPIEESRHKMGFITSEDVVTPDSYSSNDKQRLEFLQDTADTLKFIEDTARRTQISLGAPATAEVIPGWQY